MPGLLRWTMLVGGCVGMLAGVSAADTLTFDDISAPILFSDAVPLTTEYASEGITFGGNGAILDEDSGFGVMGFSSPNFVAYEEGAFIGPPGPGQVIGNASDVVIFSSPASSVMFLAGGMAFGTPILTVSAFNASSTPLGTLNAELTSTLQLINLGGLSGISRLEFELANADLGDALIVDNFSFQEVQPIPEPASILLLSSGLAAAGVRAARSRRR